MMCVIPNRQVYYFNWWQVMHLQSRSHSCCLL
ncbi:hypothetical protein ERO13_A07G095301v2 [Gossypium hirsutum]|uniref:Uncharacterized protein n=1 Tax=Gossypium barbadense TaxID=3634 RepID=A0A5J5V294_GOSBA|nr:hypothetical protein ES319_A07G104400v1 [Gossypium barbadense]KAG4191466.1 hypothetical protein ERO13_A07G095301v2 [Gossypium hirsutum]